MSGASARVAEGAGSRGRVLRSFLRSPSALFGAATLVLIVFAALFADALGPVDPAQQNLVARLVPPGTVAEDGTTYLLGTDGLGRDVLSGVIYGSRVSLIVAVAAVALGVTVGLALGVVSGYLGGTWDAAIMRAVDVTIVLPFLLLALVLRISLGPGLGSIIVALGLSGWAVKSGGWRLAQDPRTFGVGAPDMRALLDAVGCPVVLARGEHDGMVSHGELEALVSHPVTRCRGWVTTLTWRTRKR